MATPTWINVKDSYSAKGDGKQRSDALIGGGALSTLYCHTSKPFALSDVGKKVIIHGAGTGGADLVTAISGYTDTETVTIFPAATTAVSGAYVAWGTDDTAAIQSAVTAVGGATITPPGGILLTSVPLVYFPQGIYILTDEITVEGYVGLVSDFGAILYQLDATKRILNFHSFFWNSVRGLKFLGGTNQIYLSNANVDDAIMEIYGCEFQQSTSYAVCAIDSDARSSTGSMTAASATLTITESKFTSDDATYNRPVTIVGAGPGGATLFTTITGFTSATVVTVAQSATTNASGVDVGWADTLSANLSIRKCRFFKPRKVLFNDCDSAVVEDCWISVSNDNFDDDSSAFYNRSGRLFLTNMFGVPTMGTTYVSDAAMTSASAVLTCSTSTPFVAGDVGKTICVAGAGANGKPLVTTIASYTNSSHVNLSSNAGTTCSGKFASWGTTRRIYNARWVDQRANRPPCGVWANNCRFGGEDAGMPIVYNFGGPSFLYPYMGSVIAITNSQLSAGLAALPDSSVVNLQTDVPQSMFIHDNFYLSDVPFVKNGGTVTLASYFSGIASAAPNVLWKHILEPNTSRAAPAIPAEIVPYTQPLDPSAMFSATPQNTSGVTWLTGQRVWASAPVAGGPIGWVCLSGGTPGTWAEFGNIAPSSTSLTLGNSANTNITPTSNYCRITGPTALFELTSIVAGTDGQQVTFLNTTTQTMKVKHATGTAANQIYCKGLVDFSIVGQYGTVTLRYGKVDSSNFRWQVIASN